jgi:hypothetical protein
VADVVAGVEVRVVGPHRPALPERDLDEPLAVARDEVEPALDVLEQLGVGRRLALEHHARPDVPVRPAGLEVQERRVEAGQPVGVRHRGDCAHGPPSLQTLHKMCKVCPTR